jgi:MFS family permease
LLRDDRPFRRFVTARTLLLVSALAPPFVVTLATREGGPGLAGLGPFVISSGLAALLGGRTWGRLADRSSRRAMTLAAGAASLIVLGFLAVLQLPGRA